MSDLLERRLLQLEARVIALEAWRGRHEGEGAPAKPVAKGTADHHAEAEKRWAEMVSQRPTGDEPTPEEIEAFGDGWMNE